MTPTSFQADFLRNCELRLGTFSWIVSQIDKIVPIFEKGVKNDVSNYRSISVLSYFSNLYEKLVYNRLSDYTKTYNIVCHSQHGFQQGHSTYMALINRPYEGQDYQGY